MPDFSRPISRRQGRRMPRAVLFIDGNNWYHGLQKIGMDSRKLDYQWLARKLLQDKRELAEIRFYIGRVSKDLMRMRKQENFFKALREQGVAVFPGHVAKMPRKNQVIRALQKLMREWGVHLPAQFRDTLDKLCSQGATVYAEKQVDVHIAVDLVLMAQRDEYDAAYLLSADSDFVPAVKEVRMLDKNVFAVSALFGSQLGDEVDAFIRLDANWFNAD